MTDSLTIGKRALAIAAASATILWSVGVSALVAPLSASAATPGTLVRGTTLSTVYYYASNGMRYAFPNEKTYSTWFSDFSGVQTISDTELAGITLGGNIVYRPGTRWIKIQSDPKTYVVTPQGQIRWIESEEVAMGLAGSDWNKMIDDVSDIYFVDYTVGASVTSAKEAYNGALVSMDGNTYLVWNGMKQMVTSAGFTANWYQTGSLLDGTGVDLSGLTAGSDISSRVPVLTDPAQLGETITGGLSVSLASSTAVSVTLPGGADAVPFTTFKLMANGGPVTVSNLTLNLGGVGATSNIDNVYLFDSSKRLTDGRSVNSSTRQVMFSGLNIALANGETKYITVKADTSIDAGAGDTANFSLASASSLTSTASISGSFPVMGNSMTFANQTAGTVTVTANGSVSDPTIGQEGALIGKFTLTASNEDSMLKEITLNIDNASDHSNFKLWKGSSLLATGIDIGRDLVSFVLTNPLMITEGSDENLRVSADIGGSNGDNVIVTIDNSVDVVAVGADFGFNSSVTVDDYSDGSSTCTFCTRSTVQGGDLTFAFNGPAAGDLRIDGDKQTLMKFSITSEQFVDLKEFKIKISGNNLLKTTTPNFELFTLRKTDGTVWMGPEELTTGGDNTLQTLVFTDDQTLNAGETIDLLLTVDVLDTGDVATTDDIKATLDLTTVDAEDINGDAVDNIVPGTTIVGNTFNFTNAGVTVQVASTPNNGTYVKGSTAVPVVGFSFEATDASDVMVTDFTLKAIADTDIGDGVTDEFDGDIQEDVYVRDYINVCSLYDNETGALVDGPESFNTSGTVLFQNFAWTVPAGETKKLVAKCNFNNLDTVDGNSDEYLFYIDTIASDIQAEDEDGKSVDASGTILNKTIQTTVITIADSGTLTLTLDGSTPKSTIILGNSTGVVVGSWKLASTNEAFNVTKVTLSNSGTGPVATDVKLSCQNQAGATVSKTSSMSGTSVSFSALDCYVPASGNSVFTASIDTNSVSTTGGATSGDSIQLTFEDTATFEAIGVGSGERIIDAGTDAVANEMILRKTKPTISLASGSPSGAGIPGFNEIFRFNVAADSRGYVVLDGISFQANIADALGGIDSWAECGATGLGVAADWTFYDAADPSTELDDDADWNFYESDGSLCENDDLLSWAVLDLSLGATPAEEIGAGETRTYVLEVNTTGASTSDDDSIRIDIPSEATATASLLDAITWEDDSDTNEINGDLIKNLPVRGGSIIY